MPKMRTKVRILGMKKVPRLLTPDNKRNHETNSEQCLTLHERNP